MKYNIIKTGSKGNATLIDDFILIDCGVGFELLKDFYKKIKIVFITHKHSDHLNKSCVKKLAELRPTLKFVVCDYLVDILLKCGVKKNNCIVLKVNEWYDFKAFKCRFDELSHDVNNVAIHIDINGEKLIYATDTCALDNVDAKDYDYYLIEGNYKEEELKQRKQIKLLNGEYSIEDRIENTHLSYEKCVDYFMRMSKDTSVLEIMHKHQEEGDKENE